ncbi:hypothetical protein PZE19_13360 [Paludisphaera sp. Pla2]|uniref:Uncharacterized protein n=1 Tax=Paludisphaera mucosa TaxID=3030827 RepID=A0ABT6FB09_9BACT|nr:hypothetical protein [Paludisphaera mucosa]MDG3004770.1 hypothetical protein [Paludisphaera mucosa]
MVLKIQAWNSGCCVAQGREGLGLLAGGTHEHGPAIGDLAEDERSGQAGRSPRVVGEAVLAAAEQDVARFLALDAGRESAVDVEEGEPDPALDAGGHELGAGGHRPEADHAAEVVHRDLQAGPMFDPHRDVLVVLGQVGARRRHVERIVVAAQGASSGSST